MFLKNALKKFTIAKSLYTLIRVMWRKDPKYIFFSVDVARRRALRERSNLILPKIAAAHRTAGTFEITTVENALAIPLREGKDRDYSGGLIAQATGDLIEEAIHIRSNNQTAVFAQELPVKTLANIQLSSLPEIKSVVMFGGLLYQHFGHFLLESLGRLWAYEKVRHLDPYIFFLLAYDPPEYLAKDNFAYQIFNALGIPLDRILFVKEPTRIRAAIVPCQKYGYAHLLRPGADFVDFVRGFQYDPQSPLEFQDAEKIYISRSALKPGTGKAVGEVFFEEYLKTQGYVVFHPENYTIYQQLSVYSTATKLLFLDGSAIHTCILLPDLRAEVAVIARRTESRYDISTIIDQFRGYGQKVSWIDCVKEQYLFGLESWQAVGVVEWQAVSKQLMACGFVTELMPTITESAFHETLESVIQEHVKAIATEAAFIEYMVEQNRLKEA